MAGARFPSFGLRTDGARWAVLAAVSRVVDRDDDVGDLRAFGFTLTEDARELEATERAGTGYFVRSGKNEALGKDGAAGLGARIARERFWYTATAQLLVAGVCGECHEPYAGRQLLGDVEYLSSVQARPGSDRHECARIAHGAGGDGCERRRVEDGAIPFFGIVEADISGRIADAAA